MGDHFIISAIMAVLKFVWKVLRWTGLWLLFAVLIVGSMFRYPIIENNLVMALCLVFAGIVTLLHVIRIFKPDFKLGTLFSKTAAKRKEAATTDPRANELLFSKPCGVVFGKQHGKWACKPSNLDGHIAVFGGAGSGKSTTIVVPTLLSWNSAAFVIDVKGVLVQQTSNKRREGVRHNVKVFNPSDANAAGYDPFLLVRQMQDNVLQKQDKMYDNGIANSMQEIAQALIPKSADIKEPFWVDAARNFLTGSLIFSFLGGFDFPQSIQMILNTEAPSWVEVVCSQDDSPARPFMTQFASMDERTLSGVVSEMANHIMVFATDPNLVSALSAEKENTVSPADLMAGDDVYLVLEEAELDRWSGLVTLMVQQFLKAFERRPESEATPVLFLLDEFPRLRKVEAVTTGMATLRSKKVTVAIVAQSLGQLDLIYGEHQRKVLLDNAAYTAVLSATDADTQDYFSRRVGTYDKTYKSSSTNKRTLSLESASAGTSTSEQERRIIKPEEFSSLTQTVLLCPQGFYRLDRAPFYENERSFPY